MIGRLLARHRLAIRHHAGWVSYPVGGRPRGPRPILALHRLPDPDCLYCGGEGEVIGAVYGEDEPDYDDCECAPFLPLRFVWLPHSPRWLRIRRACPACGTRSRTCGCYSNQPPF
ncbi:hypothetical protein RB628_04325 [Streptomyces sp. ADMS]|uniref:hypothetical protein n=1 Tax=Streptomyces sp. ADMS TaxID=3071415 RepID=UPI00296FFF49|nr:hypothetical protein [Streptomyces sp. ADMS]MDW4904586.1 hypothetical protein [Streptomyces sp. ADMS]